MRKSGRVLIFAAIGAVAACSDISSDSPIDCSSLVGHHFIVMQPSPSGTIYDYTIHVGDSVRLAGSVRRADAAAPIFDPLGGWSCATTGSSAVPAVVTFTTNDTQLIRLNADGWVRGLSFGTATITATSASPAAIEDIDILVIS